MCRYLNHSHIKNALFHWETAWSIGWFAHGGYQEFDQYLILVMMNNMAEERCEFEFVEG